MNLPRLSVDELESILDSLPASSPDDLLAVVRAAAEAQRLKDEQWMREQKPVAEQFQDTATGRWHDFMSEQHRLNTIADGRWPIRQLYAAPAPASQEDCWLPIETAPFDELVLLCARDGYITIDRWGDFAKFNMPGFTHWQPLPAAPVTTKEAEHG